MQPLAIIIAKVPFLSHTFYYLNPLLNVAILLIFQGASPPRWEPQIAVLCEAGQSYHPQHLSEEGRWTTALNIKTAGTTCLRDKMDLLDHCKKVNNYIMVYKSIGSSRLAWANPGIIIRHVQMDFKDTLLG